MIHPLRRRILREIDGAAGPLSPTQLARAFDLPLGVVVYHIAVLQKCGALETVGAEDG